MVTIIALLILVNGLFGLFVASLYYPASPLYLFQNARPEEIWLWSKYVAFLSATLICLALLALDTSNNGRDIAKSLSAFVATLQGILCLPPIVLYWIFLEGASTATIAVRGQSFDATYTELFLITILVIVSWSSASYLALIPKHEKQEETQHHLDLAA